MKKYIFSILALAGFAACSTDSELNEAIAPEQKETFTLNASIATPDESRVSIEGEHYTEVSWEAGDFISIRSASGVGNNGRAVLQAESAGSTNVRFTGDLTFTQNTDTYYAVYPERTFDKTTISVNYAEQDGSAKKAALLVGTATDAYKYDVNMTFKPVNALIHVTLTGAPATASKVVLQRMGNEKEITPIYSYNVENGSGTLSGSSTAITVTPSSNSFFIALPAGLELDNYELVFTVGDKTFAKGFAGKAFAMGTTTNVNVAWETPSVTLGAKTSYSYYINDGNGTRANKCDNSTIYFNQSPNGDKCYSSYAGIQDAMITDCGFVVDGTRYNTSNGVIWEKSTNQFYMNNLGGQAWQAHTVQAFIVTKHNGTIVSSADLHVTGLPYKANPPKSTSTDALNGWTKGKGNAHDFTDSYLQLGVSAGQREHTVYKDFNIPTTINVSVASKFDAHNAPVNTTSSILIGNTTIASVSSGGGAFDYKTSTYENTVSTQMGESSNRVTLRGSYCVTSSRSRFYYINIDYR